MTNKLQGQKNIVNILTDLVSGSNKIIKKYFKIVYDADSISVTTSDVYDEVQILSIYINFLVDTVDLTVEKIETALKLDKNKEEDTMIAVYLESAYAWILKEIIQQCKEKLKIAKGENNNEC